MGELHHARSSVYSLQYHVVVVTKYRRPVLDDGVRETVIRRMREVCKDRGVTIEEANGEQDHVHLLIDARPTTDIPNLVKAMKGISARVAFRDHPEIKGQLWGGHLWSPSYFIATVSDNTEARIREYIRNQGETKPDQQHMWEATLRRSKARARAARKHG